ncbi:YceI family protein [Runella slithyformis DSM 19594]|uniref:YceI family protein n=2 Tax=Runella TaxID=105 RepID=A0A7U3ZLF0_RUNSL|nr:YceI family protein [Runella slithyformis DSM 19594]
MKKTLFFLFCVSISGSGMGQTWQPVSSGIGFSVKMLGVTVEGSFRGLAANLKFNPETPTAGSLSATVDAATVDTDNALRNRHLREKEDFFEAANYPKISLKSTKIEKAANGYIGHFDLTIKSITKSVKVPFTFSQTDNKATFTGTFMINRRDWALGGNTFGMSNEVTIRLTVNAILK